MRASHIALLTVALHGSIALTTAMAGQPLEAETARMLGGGHAEIATSIELQRSSEGGEAAWPWFVEYGVSDRVDFAVEPVAYTAIHPNDGRKATGAGDLEATATFLLGQETSGRPAIAFAAEVKLPLAKDPLIGTGKTDVAGYLILSRTFNKCDVHGNLGYTVLGEPEGVSLNNLFSFGLAGEYHAHARWDFVGEVFASTSAAPGVGESGRSPQTPTEQTAEIAGGEAFVMAGARFHISPGCSFDFGLVYDNNNAVLVRPGITARF